MAKKIENHKFTIEEAFTDCFYIIPDYQREYIWKEKEVTKLLEDINDEIDGSTESEYFIGTILVSATKEKNHYEVIDGQQRLTTFYLILCALRTLINSDDHISLINGLITKKYTNQDGDIEDKRKLELRYENSDDLLKIIVNSNGDVDSINKILIKKSIVKVGSIENIINAYEIILQFLQVHCVDLKGYKKYWSYLSRSIAFIQIETDVTSALKIFETINERGVGLNPMDLLKNLLFTNVKLEDFNELKIRWKKVSNPLEKKKEKSLRFLRYFLMANYITDNARKDNIVREDEIYEWLTKKENAKICAYTTKDGALEFVDKIILNVTRYINYIDGKGNDSKENSIMTDIRQLTGGAFSLHYVLLLAASPLPKPLFDHLIKQLETFLFYYIITKTSTKELEKNFSKWADILRNICEIDDEDEQKQKLNEFITEKLQKNANDKHDDFVNDLMRYNLLSLQQYRTRYLLAKIAQYVDKEFNGFLIPKSLDNFTKYEIEHILPNNPEDELKNEFSLDENGKEIYNYDDYKVKLGNLTLLEKPLNIIAGRKFFDEKTPEYKKTSIYLTKSIVELITAGNNSSINRISKKLIQFDDWTATSIDERQLMLVNLAEDIWKIKPLEG